MGTEAIAFNLELAQSGWPVVYQKWGRVVHFVGTTKAGDMVVEDTNGCVLKLHQADLAMGRKTTSDRSLQSVSVWFGLSYGQFLIVPRVIMEEMPMQWQYAMTALLNQMDEQWNCLPADGRMYYVRVGKSIPWPYEDSDGNPIEPVLQEPDDDLCNYRRPNIEHRRKKPEPATVKGRHAVGA